MTQHHLPVTLALDSLRGKGEGGENVTDKYVINVAGDPETQSYRVSVRPLARYAEGRDADVAEVVVSTAFLEHLAEILEAAKHGEMHRVFGAPTRGGVP